jgi:hypothetical protein
MTMNVIETANVEACFGPSCNERGCHRCPLSIPLDLPSIFETSSEKRIIVMKEGTQITIESLKVNLVQNGSASNGKESWTDGI